MNLWTAGICSLQAKPKEPISINGDFSNLLTGTVRKLLVDISPLSLYTSFFAAKCKPIEQENNFFMIFTKRETERKHISLSLPRLMHSLSTHGFSLDWSMHAACLQQYKFSLNILTFARAAVATANVREHV